MEKLITENLELWTGAVTQKSASGRGSSSKRELTGIKKLRELILELAVRGKLVPQDPGDEPASLLIEEIEATRSAAQVGGRRKAGAVKSNDWQRTDTLPNGWDQRTLGQLATVVRGVTYKKEQASDSPSQDSVALFRANNIQESIVEEGVLYVPGSLVKAEQITRQGDILIAMSSGSSDLVGKAAQITIDSRATFGAFCAVIRPSIETLSPFLGFYAKTPFYRKQTRSSGKGIGIQNLNKAALEALVVWVPPLAEQHRIVQKVDELMALCDQLEQQSSESIEAHERLVDTLLDTLTRAANATELAENWARVAQHFDTLFTTEHSIDRLKQTILQLAVMGRLVPQDSADEPATSLIEKINAEKQLLAPISRSNRGHSGGLAGQLTNQVLPDGWCMAFLADLGITSTGKTPSTKNAQFWGEDVSFIGPGQITLSGEILKSEKFLSKEGVAESEEALPGDLLMVCIGGSIGKSAKCRDRLAFNQQINKIRPVLMDPDFLLIAMQASAFQDAVLERATGSATPIINRSKWETIPIPVPPLAEQGRIVEMVDRLKSLCGDVEVGMNSAGRIQMALASAVVEKSVN